MLQEVLVERVPPQSVENLRQILRDVELTEGPHRAFLGAPSWRVRIGWGRPLHPWEVGFILGDILGCRDFGHGEKLAWEHALKFESVSLTVAFQKFGLRAYVDANATDEQGAEDLVTRLMSTLG